MTVQRHTELRQWDREGLPGREAPDSRIAARKRKKSPKRQVAKRPARGKQLASSQLYFVICKVWVRPGLERFCKYLKLSFQECSCMSSFRDFCCLFVMGSVFLFLEVWIALGGGYDVCREGSLAHTSWLEGGCHSWRTACHGKHWQTGRQCWGTSLSSQHGADWLVLNKSSRPQLLTGERWKQESMGSLQLRAK